MSLGERSIVPRREVNCPSVERGQLSLGERSIVPRSREVNCPSEGGQLSFVERFHSRDYISMIRVSSTGGCRGEASPPNPPTSPPKVLKIKCLCVNKNNSNNKIPRHYSFCALVNDTQEWAYGTSQTWHAFHTIMQSAHTIFPPKQKILDETLMITCSHTHITLSVSL